MPLPNFTLLDMQFKLSQIVSLSAAAEDTELLESDPIMTIKPPLCSSTGQQIQTGSLGIGLKVL